jgi:UDP-glucose 4-epimerase
MKYMVTGGAGFIGSNLSEELLNHGDLCIIDDLSSGEIKNIKHLVERGAEFSQTSILDYKKLVKLTKDIDYIFHLAAVPGITISIENPVYTNKVNIEGTLNILEAARKNNVKKVVYSSSSSIYGDNPILPLKENMNPEPKSPYAVSKLAAEYYCYNYSQIYGLPTISLRYFNVYGPRQNPDSEYSAVIPIFITKILRRENPTIYGDGSITRDFVFVKDVVQANIQSMRSNVEGIFNVALGSQINLNTLVELVMDITGIYVDVMYGPERIGDIKASYACIDKAKKLLDFKPKYKLKKGLEETIEWYRGYLEDLK